MDDNAVTLNLGDGGEGFFEKIGDEEAIVPRRDAAVEFGEESEVDGICDGTVGGKVEVGEGGEGGKEAEAVLKDGLEGARGGSEMRDKPLVYASVNGGSEG